MSSATTDLSDAHPAAQVAEPIFGDFGGQIAFHGAIKTLKVFEDNAAVRATLETPGEGRVLVVVLELPALVVLSSPNPSAAASPRRALP